MSLPYDLPAWERLPVNPLNELNDLLDLFPESDPLVVDPVHVPGSQVPEPYQSLLVHEHHMTVTMENFHDCTVDVVVVEEHNAPEAYTRKILLKNSSTDLVVQFGIVRFNFDYVTEAVKREILEGKTPLGRVLIRHNILRHIDLGAIVKFNTGPAMAKYFNCEAGVETYGRLATIFCNNQPAVDLLEVSRPL